MLDILSLLDNTCALLPFMNRRKYTFWLSCTYYSTILVLPLVNTIFILLPPSKKRIRDIRALLFDGKHLEFNVILKIEKIKRKLMGC